MTAARLLRVWKHRLRAILRRDDVDREVASELAFHHELLVRERIEAGLSREEAMRDAAVALGNVAVLQDQCRDQRRVAWVHDFHQDLVHGFRVLRRSPTFTIVAVASLALGIGANAAVLGVAKAIAFGPLPFPDSDRLVVIRTVPPNAPGQQAGVLISEFVAWRDRSHAFEEIGVSHGFPGDLSGDAEHPAQRLDGYIVERGFFRTLGAQPIAGRLFYDRETLVSGIQPIVIGERLWRQRFAADPSIVGRHVRLSRKSAIVVGVLPATFAYPHERVDYWAPLIVPNAPPVDTSRLYLVVGKLKPGVTRAQAEADLNRIAGEVNAERPEGSAGWAVRVLSLRTVQYRWTQEPLLTLGASVVMVLLLACINLAGLLLARNAARGPELALRISLGAGRGRIIRQLLTESLMLSVLAGAGAALVAWWIAGIIRGVPPLPGLPPMPRLSIDVSMLAVVSLLVVVATLVFGVAPAFAASRGNTVDPFRNSAALSARATHRQRTRSALVAIQVALALVLLIGAGLLVNTVYRVAFRDLGFDPSHLMTFDFQIPGTEFLRRSGSYRGAAVYDVSTPPALALARVLDRVAAVPGVASAAGISHHPTNTMFLPRMPLAGLNDSTQHLSNFPVHFFVTAGFFNTMKATIVRGREIDDRDTTSSQWVAVINETMAQQYWPGRDPIGQQFLVDTLPEERPRLIVGVVRGIPTRREQTTPEPVFYTSYLQQPSRIRAPWGGVAGRLTFVVRTTGDPSNLVDEVRKAIAEVEPDRALTAITTTELGNFFWLRKAHVFAITGFALVATALAAMGLYGVMSYTLARRTREIAIRVALGADVREVIRAVGLPSLRVVVIGLAGGLAGALAFGRLIQSQLWGITATDVPTFLAAALLLVAVAGFACIPPIRRALRIDPSIALKTE